MIPFPKYLRLGGHVIKVKRVAGLMKDESAFGTWDDAALTICIDADLCGTLAWECIFHEAVEAANTAAELSLPHEKIQILGLLLHQIFASLMEQGQTKG